MPGQPPPIDTRRVAGVVCALRGGIHATAADQADAAALAPPGSGVRQRFRESRVLHSLAAKWAVTEQGVRGIVVAAAGPPCPPDPCTAALAAEPCARAVLADPDDQATLINEAVLGRDPRVTAVRARALDAAGLLHCPQVKALPGPLLVLLPFVATLWPAAVAAAALAEYALLLPPGSLLCLSLWVPDGGPAGQRFLALWRERVSPVYGHRPEDVAGWLAAAGFRGITRPQNPRPPSRPAAGATTPAAAQGAARPEDNPRWLAAAGFRGITRPQEPPPVLDVRVHRPARSGVDGAGLPP